MAESKNGPVVEQGCQIMDERTEAGDFCLGALLGLIQGVSADPGSFGQGTNAGKFHPFIFSPHFGPQKVPELYRFSVVQHFSLHNFEAN